MNPKINLFEKYIAEKCTTEEIQQLMEQFSDADNEEELKIIIAKALNAEGIQEEEELDERLLKVYSRIKQKTVEQKPKHLSPAWLWNPKYIAAAILIIVSAGIYTYFSTNINPAKARIGQRITADVNPGGNKAVLTLGDGSSISLTDASNGQILSKSGITITKTADGQLSYQVSEKTAQIDIGDNTITTPNGGQYQVVLPDGTTVWLNSASSLKYPSRFSASQRKVTLQGEAYFEVTKDKSKPFIVSSVGAAGIPQNVEVLGTHFNISCYKNDNAVKTTLLEGSVQISLPLSGIARIIKPGQQAVVKEEIKVIPIDTESVIDWKNGNFYFNNENIEVIMNKLSRWYDVEVIYKGDSKEIFYGGEISRNKKLSEVLKVLEATGTVKFNVEGRRITVMQ